MTTPEEQTTTDAEAIVEFSQQQYHQARQLRKRKKQDQEIGDANETPRKKRRKDSDLPPADV